MREAGLRCDRCGEVIGAYEPVVVLVDDRPRETSVAAEPALPLDGAQHLHRACFVAGVSQEVGDG